MDRHEKRNNRNRKTIENGLDLVSFTLPIDFGLNEAAPTNFTKITLKHLKTI